MNPSLTTDLFLFKRAKAMKKKISAIRIGGNVITSRVLSKVKFNIYYTVMMLVYLYRTDIAFFMPT